MKKRAFALLLCLFFLSFVKAELYFLPETVKSDNTAQEIVDTNLNISYFVPKSFKQINITEDKDSRYVFKGFTDDNNTNCYIELEKNSNIKSYVDYIKETKNIIKYQALNINEKPCLLIQYTNNMLTLVDVLAEGYIFKINIQTENAAADEEKRVIKQIYASVMASLPNINLTWADERYNKIFGKVP